MSVAGLGRSAAAASPPRRPAVVATNLRRVFTGVGGQRVEALRGVSLDIATGEFLSVLGPSGCGKSTLLNMIAGFDTPTEGEILVNGKPVAGPSAERGVVFQDSAALFPWYTVRGNIEFGLRSRGVGQSERKRRVDEVLELVRLTDFADALPRQLSGGMRQLCAIGRVIVMQARVLLMDEPFGALDAITRSHMQQQLVDIWRRTGVTILFITHSVDEAIYLGDRVVVMSGRPGSMKADIPIDLSRPRDVTSPEFNRIKARAVGLLEPRRDGAGEAAAPGSSPKQ